MYGKQVVRRDVRTEVGEQPPDRAKVRVFVFRRDGDQHLIGPADGRHAVLPVECVAFAAQDFNFRRQVFGCFWFEQRMVSPVIDALGASQVLFETDFPHPTCLYPDPLASAAEALAGLGDDVQRRVLQDNAAALYKVPLPVAG